MYKEIEYLHLIAKEFQMHDHCRETSLKEFGDKHRLVTKPGGLEVIYVRNNFIRCLLKEVKWANYKKWLKNHQSLISSCVSNLLFSYNSNT